MRRTCLAASLFKGATTVVCDLRMKDSVIAVDVL